MGRRGALRRCASGKVSLPKSARTGIHPPEPSEPGKSEARMKEVAIGLIGAGTVGGGVVKILHARRHALDAMGVRVRLARIADKATARFAALPVGDAVCTANAEDILNDPSIHIVVELVGGTTFAKKVVLDALSRGKHVITANKALIAECGTELFECASKRGVSLYFEASVGGGMPVIKTIREALAGNEIVSVKTIINGTCNYILTRMTVEGLPFTTVLTEAQKNGYAEADPTLDVGGGDAGHKVAILASLISGGYVPFNAVFIEGITAIGGEDIAFARDLGYVIKLLGVINRKPGSGAIDARVHPAMLPSHHILASVSDVFNAVLLEGDAVGRILLYGKGAGEMPTGSAVVSDIVDIARNIAGALPCRIPMEYYGANRVVPVQPIEKISSRYYLRFTVTDKPGVLGSIAAVLGGEGISIASVMQREGYADDSVPVIILTHRAKEQGVRRALATIEKMDFIRQNTRVIRIEE
ncbi:MAG: homoserine dehydrogenase [Chitinispirillaceae bacterium]|nr:homoserine dehydrogenase [Chitinispirillaceae bacterium]